MWTSHPKVPQHHPWGSTLALLVHHLDRHHAPIAASAMAFDAFLSLVPLAAFAGYILHLLHQSGETVIDPILHAAPLPARELVESAIVRLSGNSGAVIAPLSIGAFLWTTSSGLSTAMYVFEAMFLSVPRPWWLRRILAMACVLSAIALIALVTAMAVGAARISATLGSIVAVILPTAVLAGMLAAFFRIAVQRDRHLRRRHVLPGVLVTVSLWAVVSTLFSFYVSTLSRYATLYGGLAAVAIFLFWLWLLALALLVGGEVNAQLDGVRTLPFSSLPTSALH